MSQWLKARAPELLRKAATIVRERAEAASAEADPPWTPMGQTVQAFNGTEIPTSPEDTREQDDVTDYIATMHPGVGLALADWLDDEAGRVEAQEPHAAYPIDLARLIVGEEWR